MTVYYTKVFPFLEEGTFFTHNYQIEEKRLQDIGRKKNKDARARSLAAGILLQAGLCDFLNCPPESTPPFQTGLGQWGKPYLVDHPEIYFNLSHSGEYVCCGIADFEVGVDVQRHQMINDGLSRRFFSEEDNRILDGMEEKDREEFFFRIWSVRESYVKLTGRGLGQGLSSFEIDWKHQTIQNASKEPVAFFEEKRDLEGYSLCVCGRRRIMQPGWIFMEFGEKNRGEKKI